jgi:uncharacterized RDD family membrane protein YckC
VSRWRDVRRGKIRKKELKLETPEFVVAPLVNRVKSFITDTFLLLMPLIYISFYLIMGSREEFAEHLLLGWASILVPHLLIIVGFWFFKSQTPGYKAYNIKLVDNNLQRPSVSQLIVRYFAFILSTFMFAGLILAIIRKDKRTLHDIISGTMLIQIEA